MKVRDKKKLALVLSGGGIKAASFHLGVCLALREKGFHFAGGTPADVRANAPDDSMTFKTYVGSSAGAVVTTFLAAGYSIEAIIDAFKRGNDSDLSKLLQRAARTSQRRQSKSTSRSANFGGGGLDSVGSDGYAPGDIGGVNSEGYSGVDRREQPRARLKPLTYRDIFSLNGGSFVNWVPNVLRRESIVTGGLEALLKNGFKVNGLFHARGMERYLRQHVLQDNRFSALGVDLFIVATQLNHSRKVIFGNFSETVKQKNIKYANYSTISDAVAASASLPPVFAPYGIANQKGRVIYFFDGEIRDTLSTHVAADHGCDLVISSYSIQPYHYNPAMGSLHEYGIPLIVNQALYQVIQQKIERHIDHQQQISAIMSAIDGYFKQAGLPAEHKDRLLEIITKRVNYKAGVDYLYIHPSPHDHEMFFTDHFSLSPEILGRIVHIGFRAALQTLRKLDM